MLKWLCLALALCIFGLAAIAGGYLAIFAFILHPTGIQIGAVTYCFGWFSLGVGILGILTAPFALLTPD